MTVCNGCTSECLVVENMKSMEACIACHRKQFRRGIEVFRNIISLRRGRCLEEGGKKVWLQTAPQRHKQLAQ